MAEINGDSQGTSKPKNIRSRKMNSRVDLTAMVDLAFLLITFFMLTTSLGKPTSMELAMPEAKGKPMPIDENRTMTILIGSDNNARYYMGKFSESAPVAITLDKNVLRKELALRKKEVLDYSTAKDRPDQGMIVLIKPGKNSHYGNLIDVLDEMAISGIQTYAIVDIESDENEVIKFQ